MRSRSVEVGGVGEWGNGETRRQRKKFKLSDLSSDYHEAKGLNTLNGPKEQHSGPVRIVC